MIPTVDFLKNICETPHHRNLKTTMFQGIYSQAKAIGRMSSRG
jgi:hypothetical protein